MSFDRKGKGRMMELRESPTEIEGKVYHRSAPFQCPSANLTLPSSHISPKFQLLIRQDPIKGFSAGMDIAARKNARITPLDPPPICEMIVLPFDKEEGEDQMDEIQRARYLSTVEVCIHVCLVQVEEPNKEIQDKNLDSNGILLVGNLVESPFIAPCTPPMLKDECFFIFSELSVKCSGHYRLRYNLIDRANNQFRTLASVLGDPFTVYPQKKRFGSFIESSCLMKNIVARGLRLRVSKGSQISEEEKQQQQNTKKKRKISDNCELHLPSHNQSQFWESRPRAISDCDNSMIHPNEYLPPLHKKTISSFYSTTEKSDFQPLSSSSSSSSRSTHRNESTSEAFYPAVSGIHLNSTLSSKIEKDYFYERKDSKRERYDLEWSRKGEEEDENWQTKRRSSFTPSYTHNRRATYDGYQLRDEKSRHMNNSRPLYIGERYQSTEIGWHTPCIRSLSFHSSHHHNYNNDSLKSGRWQDVPPILPPLQNNRPKTYSLEFEERQKERSSNGFHDDFNRYALSKRYEATKLDPHSDYSRRDCQ